MVKRKRLINLVVVLVAVGLIGAVVVFNVMNKPPSATLSTNERMMAVMEAGDCMMCHVPDAKLPFYASLPIAKGMITKHVENGYQLYDIAPLMEAIENGTAANEVDLAKMEKVTQDNEMPLLEYSLAHWGSFVRGEKKQIILDWVKEQRATFYPNTLAAPEFANEPVRPIPDAVQYDPAKAKLGDKLYHDTRLSADGTVSCATCHDINTAGVDNLALSEGIGGQLGGVNAPTVYNAVFHFAQFWDGRAATLAEQAAGPPLNPVEMGFETFDQIVDVLMLDDEFTATFAEVYPDGWSEAAITDAIEHYERTLVTPNSAFDRYLKGEKDAMTAQQIEGYEQFKEHKCATCHAGVAMGGLTYELMGQRENYFENRELQLKSGLTDSDNGRWAVTGVERDRYRFKTPGLRNVALTYPYYHDGSVESLEEAVDMMATYQVGVNLTHEQINLITNYLHALTGEYKGELLVNANDE